MIFFFLLHLLRVKPQKLASLWKDGGGVRGHRRESELAFSSFEEGLFILHGTGKVLDLIQFKFFFFLKP